MMRIIFQGGRAQLLLIAMVVQPLPYAVTYWWLMMTGIWSCHRIVWQMKCNERITKTRMHSSRMRTARLCIVLGGGMEVLSPGLGGREGGVVTWSGGGGREVLSPGAGVRCCHMVPGGGRCCDLVTHLPPRVGQTDACENITFARFAMRVVIKS